MTTGLNSHTKDKTAKYNRRVPVIGKLVPDSLFVFTQQHKHNGAALSISLCKIKYTELCNVLSRRTYWTLNGSVIRFDAYGRAKK